MRKLWDRIGGAHGVVAITLLAAALLIGAAGVVGCCTTVPERRASAEDLLKAWRVHRRAVVPHPGLSNSEARGVDCRKRDGACGVCDACEVELALEALAGAEGAR